MSYELPDPHRDEDDCGCRSSATCARHLEEADLTLEHVPMGKQTEDVAADSSAGFVPAFAESGFPPGFEWSEEEGRPTVVRYSAQEIAEILRVTERTVRRWIDAGRLEAVKEGGIYRIDLDEARAVHAESRPGAATHRQHLADRVEWLQGENDRLWALLEKVVTRA